MLDNNAQGLLLFLPGFTPLRWGLFPFVALSNTML
jgi:hypothetical protein